MSVASQAPAGAFRAPTSEELATARLSDRDRSLLVDRLRQLVKSVGVDEVADKFARYYALLVAWNERGNIFAKNDLPRLVERHFLESLTTIEVVDRLGSREIVDIGSGGGFPGIPIQIVRPDLHVTLLESRRMKSLFLQSVVRHLDLRNASVLQMRAEDTSSSSSGGRQFDLATARAVAALSELTAWAAHLVKSGGHLLTFKGSRLEEELSAWSRTDEWREPEIHETNVPHLRLVILQRT